MYDGKQVYLCLEVCPVSRWGVAADKIGEKIDKFQQADAGEASNSKTCVSLPVRLLQVNPCTRRDLSKRRAYLSQCRAEKVHIMFAQETRLMK